MNYEIVELAQFSGNKTTVYSVILEGDNKTLFDHFVLENATNHKNEVKFIVNRIKEIGKTTGARLGYFKPDEGKLGDGVCALYDDPDNNLRLYCIRYSSVAIILGGGGIKDVRAWQENEKLSLEATRMIQVSSDIMQRLKEGDLKWSPDGCRLEGNLTISDDEE